METTLGIQMANDRGDNSLISPLVGALQQQDRLVSLLETDIATLEERLRLIMRSPPPVGQKNMKEADDNFSETTALVKQQNKRIDTMHIQLESIIQRIEL